jgi:hypothetical protein
VEALMNLPRNSWISASALVLSVAAITAALRARSQAEAARTVHAALAQTHAAANPASGQADARRAAAVAWTEIGEETPAIAVDSADGPFASAHADSHRAVRQIPALQALRLAAERAAFEMNYAPLFRALQLSPVQAAQFCDHLMRRAAAKSDLQAAAEAQRLPDHDTAVRGLADRSDWEFKEAQLALLGEAGARQAMEFERTLPVREGVATIASTATLAGVPLTAAQSEQLLRVLVAATPRNPDDTLNMREIDWERVSEQARQFLSPAQWTIFTSVETDSLAAFSAQLDRAVERAQQSDHK